MALLPLLVFVVMSGQLYPLSSDSESDSEPDESESLNVSWYIYSSLKALKLKKKTSLLRPKCCLYQQFKGISK